MKTILITLAALTLLSCDPIKRHQRLIRKHPQLLELISNPKTDTVRITNTKYIECPDGTVITVNCDTLVVYETETIQLPPTNAQIRQAERTKRNFEDNIRKMYKDSLEHAKRIYKLENKRLRNENKKLMELSEDTVKVAKTNAKGKRRGSGLFISALVLFGLFVIGLFFHKLLNK